VAAARICKLLTEQVVMGLPLSILWGNTFDEWVNLTEDDIPVVIGNERTSYLFRRNHSIPRHFSEIQSTPLQGHSAQPSAFEIILLVTTPGDAEMLKRAIDKMTDGTDFKLINMWHVDNANRTHYNLNASIDEPDNRWNIDHVPYTILTLRAKFSYHGQLSHCSSSFRILDEFHWYNTENSVGW
jgi:hypothetical protein